MKAIIFNVFLSYVSLTLGAPILDITGNYNCVDITVNSSRSSVKLNHEASFTNMRVSQNDNGDYGITINNLEMKLLQINKSDESISIKSLLVGSVKNMATSYDKIEMTFFKDANNVSKALLEGLLVRVPAKKITSPQAYVLAAECSKE